MKYARSTFLPATTAGGVTAGLDWASADHAVAIVDTAGQVRQRFVVAHTAAGLSELVRRLAKAAVTEIAIERGDGPVVEALLNAGVTVVVISPNQVKNLRSRYGSAGNKGDRFEGLLPGDLVQRRRAGQHAVEVEQAGRHVVGQSDHLSDATGAPPTRQDARSPADDDRDDVVPRSGCCWSTAGTPGQGHAGFPTVALIPAPAA